MLKDRVITIKHKYIDAISLLFLEVPFFLFLCYWSNLYIGCIVAVSYTHLTLPTKRIV